MASPDTSHRGAVIGIDLGTTNSVIAAAAGGVVRILVDPEGNQLHPSVVSFLPTGERLVGHKARLRRVIDPENTVFSAKRIIGRPAGDPGTLAFIDQVPYRVVGGDNQEVLVETRAGRMPIVDIAATVLIYLRQLAENQLGQPVTDCVVTVPANFSDGQREATRQAAQRAGMTVLRVLNEPTAAALAYGAGRSVHQRIAVFDLGGGTFDVTVLAMRGDIYEVVATGGDPFLGGDDMDSAIADVLARQFLAQHRIDLNSAPEARARLQWAAEEIKKQLSVEDTAGGTIENAAYGPDGEPLGLEFQVTRAQFEQMVRPLVNRALGLTEQVLAEAEAQPEHIDEVILVGGGTMVPLVQRLVAQFFGREARAAINPMQVVAAGAAIHADALLGGASAGAGLLMDVTSHGLGIATTRGYAELLIEKNTPIPAEGTRVFSTARDGQTAVRIRVCQGEERVFEDNALLGELHLSGLRAAPRGEVQVEVSFLVDANGILQVSAKDLATGRDETAVLSILGVASGDPDDAIGPDATGPADPAGHGHGGGVG